MAIVATFWNKSRFTLLNTCSSSLTWDHSGSKFYILSLSLFDDYGVDRKKNRLFSWENTCQSQAHTLVKYQLVI